MAGTIHAPLVYYAVRDGLIKIGTTTQFRERISRQDMEEVLAVEPGSYDLERERHAEFAHHHLRYEWFLPGDDLLAHATALRALYDVPRFPRRTPRALDHEGRAILAQLPMPVMSAPPLTLERFAAKLRPGDDGCRWRWAKPSRGTGYGVFTLNGALIGAHVASHLLFVGPVPDGWHVDHVRDRGCTHRDCVWWEHLEAVTPAENVRRGDAGKWQSEKTHCKHGHEFTPENIYWVGPDKDMRACKTCAKDAANERYRRLVNPSPDSRAGGLKGGPASGAIQRAKTHCPQGHEYTPDNIYWVGPNKDGRACKTCCRTRAAERHDRLKDDPEYKAQQARARDRRRIKTP